MWKKNNILALLMLFSLSINAQLSEADSAFHKIVDPYIWPAWNGQIESEKFLDTLAQIQIQYDSPYSRGLLAYINGKYWNGIGIQDKSLQYFVKASEILGQCCEASLAYIESEISIGFVSIHSGLMNYDTSHFNRGYKYVEKGYELAKKYGYEDTALRMLDFKGDYHYYSAYQVEDFPAALDFYLQLSNELPKVDSSYRFVGSKLNFANVYRAMGKKELSEKYFREAVELAVKHNQLRVLMAAYNDLGYDLEQEGAYEESLKYKLESYEYATSLGDAELMNRVERQVYHAYKNLDMNDKALEYLELHLQGIREMNKAEALQLQAKLASQQELDQQELEITMLENKNLSTSRNFLILLSLLSIATLGFVFWAYSRLKKTNKALLQKNREILQAQTKGQNMERKRMAGELHDNLNTKIAAVRYRLEAQALGADEKGAKMFDDTLSLVNDIYEDVRLISHNLVPEAVEEIGLLPSLEKLTSILNENNTVNFHLISELKTSEDLGHLSYQIYNAIFEMINNILKHSGANNAWISISKTTQNINVTVSDDGKGFIVEENMGGFGLKSIASRVEQLNGFFTVESSPDKGTKYFIEIPNG